MKFIVSCGGQGTKLWPYSRQDKPKQFQPIVGDTSSYQAAIETLLEEYSPEDIFISTKQKFIKYVSEQSPQIPLRNYIVEPDVAKDRGPAEGLAYARLSLLHPDEPFFLVQADCIREPRTKFLEMIRTADKIVRKHKTFITGGIKASEPNIGVDYLQLADKIGDDDAYQIKDFVYRKSTLRETRELLENYHVVAHSNHTCWYPDLMLEAYKKYRPDWFDALMQIKEAMDKPGEQETIRKIYEQMEKGATEDVTKHLMAGGEAIALLLPFRWTDVGTWTSVHEFAYDENENMFDANVVSVDSKGTLVKVRDNKKVVAIAGVRDLVIVDSDDVLLIVPRDDIDKIKDIQQNLVDGNIELL
jgi:mannose-1-phosphate guanylyltransferase